MAPADAEPHSPTLQVGTGRVDLDRGLLLLPTGESALTKLEVGLLRRLSEADGRAVSREELLREVWGYRSNVRSRSIDSTVKRLRKKIERDPTDPEVLLTVHQQGYRLRLPQRAAASRAPAAGLVGRQKELTQLEKTLQHPGVVTLLGPGGMGKSALARKLVQRMEEALGGSAWIVDLDGVDTAPQAWSRMVDTLRLRGLRCVDDAPAPAIGRSISQHGRCLVVFDGADRLAAALATAIEQFRAEAPEASWLVTSRVRLRAIQDRVLELGPLDSHDAVTLLRRRIRALRPHLAHDAATQTTLEELADRLDRMPLAIELAAGRSNLLAPAQLLEHLSDRMALLTGPRHTLESTLDASWALASPAEQEALKHLALFRSGFHLRDAEQVVRVPDGPSCLDLVQALRDHSWLRAWTPEGSDELRLGMYESVRDYVRAHGGDVREARRRHTEVFAAYGSAAALTQARRQPERLRRYRLEHPNILAAFEAAVKDDRRDLAVHAWLAARKWLHYRGPFTRVIALAELLLDCALTPTQEARVRRSTADFHRRLGDPHAAEAWAREALRLVECDPLASEERAWCQIRLAGTLTALGRSEESTELLRRADDDLQESTDWFARAHLQSGWGALHKHRGELNEARSRYRAALELTHRAHDRTFLADVTNNLASVSRSLGDHEEAILQYTAAIDAIDAIGGCSGYPRMNLANVHTRLGALEEAIQGYQEALEQARSQGNLAMEASIRTNLGAAQLLHGALDAASVTLHHALSAHRVHGARRLEVATLLILAEVALTRGDASAARRRLEEARPLAESANLALHVARIHLGSSRTALLAEDLQSAEAHLDRIERVDRFGPEMRALTCCVRGLLACARGDAEAAAHALSEAERWAPDAIHHPRSEVGSRIAELRTALRSTRAA